jgi:anti-sigma-K factor RskA
VRPDDHEEVEASLAAFVLDVADQEEAKTAAAHVKACPSCATLARRLARAAAAMALSAQEVKPPERLRARVLAAAAASPGAGGQGPPRQAVPIRASQSGRQRRPPGRPLLAALSAAALLAALAGWLGAWNMNLSAQLGEQTRLNRQLAHRNAQLAQVNDALNQRPRYHTLSGDGDLGGARGSIVAFTQEPVTVIYFSGLPQPATGKIYELWLTDSGGKRLRGPVFAPDRSGAARVWLDRSLDGVSRLGVTVEQGPNGVDAPTQPSHLKGQIA